MIQLKLSGTTGWLALGLAVAVVILYAATNATAQTSGSAGESAGFVPHTITTAADYALSVFAADLDGDGDQDALSASSDDDKLAWYENTDGLGGYGPQQIISTSANGAGSVFAADLDGDTDLDVLSGSAWDRKIAWYENTDGMGTFGPQQVIHTASSTGTMSISAADLDGDRDNDVLVAIYNDNKVAWYQNTDGLGTFGPQQIIMTSAGGAHSVFAADLDGDGDSDVVSALGDHDRVVWFENTDGSGFFGPPHDISTTADGPVSVYGGDLDRDGDIDVLSASAFDDSIAWYENVDPSGTFGPQRPISSAADFAQFVYAADLDGDGDIDALSASPDDDKVAWYENTDGQGSFGPQLVITTSADGASSVFAADLDGDGDVDVLSASANDDTIAWYENTMAEQEQPVPTVSEWGLFVMAMFVLAAGTVVLRRRHSVRLARHV